MSSADPPVLARVVRSGFVEGHHRGTVVAVEPDGRLPLVLGDPYAPIFPRSANKPLQSVGLLRHGLGDIVGRTSADEADRLVAIATSSHSGQPEHLALVARLLELAGLNVASLACPPSLPMHEASAHAVLRDGGGPSPIAMNCSGKHAGMLATCVAAGWSTADYLDPNHPVQLACRAAVESLTGDPTGITGVDGCGAALFAATPVGVARAFGRLAVAAPGTVERWVADAARSHPMLVGGAGRPNTELMTAVPGLLAKDGAEGVMAVGLPTGTGLVVKIDDGAARAMAPVTVAALRALGVRAPALDDLAVTVLLGGAVPVGGVRAVSFPDRPA